MNFTHIIKSILTKYPDKCAIIDNDVHVSYQEFWEKLNFISRLYLDKKIKHNDRILIVLPNSINFILYYFATLKIGAISVPVKESFKISEFSAIIDNCQPKLFVTSKKWLDENNDIINKLNIKAEIINTDTVEIENEKNDTGIYLTKNNDLACISYSYFGDGYPKGAALSHANLIYAAIGYSRHLGFTHDDIFLVILPMPHVFSFSGCINTPIIKGSTIVITSKYSPKFICTYIEKYNISVLTATPVLYESLSSYKNINKYDISSLRICITGGELMTSKKHKEITSVLKTNLLQGYGLTETLPILCNPPNGQNKPGSLGIPGRKDIFIRIVNTENQEVKTGEIGEILIKSPTSISGYYNQPEDTKIIIKDDWLHSGDLGKMDNDGFIHYCGLKKKIFNIYGNNIDPLELENVLQKHPIIDNAVAYLKCPPDTDSVIGSKILCADIYLKDTKNISAKEIRTYCLDKIAKYKIPKDINIFSNVRFEM